MSCEVVRLQRSVNFIGEYSEGMVNVKAED